MFSIWKEDVSGTVAYVGKKGISEVKVKSAFVKLVYIYMIDTHHDTVSPSYNEIAEDIGLSRSIVIRCVKVLQEKGLLNKQVRPTETLYHKSNVYTIHQQKEHGSVPRTPKSLNTLKPSISIEDHMSKFNKINQKWNECFNRDIGLGEFMTLTKKVDIEFLVQQIDIIKNNHHDVDTIVDAGKYVYCCIERGGFEVMEKPVYTPPVRKYSKKNNTTQSTLTKSCAGLVEAPKYCPEELAKKKARIAEKLKMLEQRKAL